MYGNRAQWNAVTWNGIRRAQIVVVEREFRLKGPLDEIHEREIHIRAHESLSVERDITARGHEDALVERIAKARAHKEATAERAARARAHEDALVERVAKARAHEDATSERPLHIKGPPMPPRHAVRRPKPVGYYIQVYDTDNKLLARLEQATEKNFTKKLNGTGEFSFQIPRSDSKSDHLVGGNIVKFFKKSSSTPIFAGILGKRQRDGQWEKWTGKGIAWLLSYYRAARNRYWEYEDYNDTADVFSDFLQGTTVSADTLASAVNPGFRANGESLLWCIATYAAQVGQDWEVDPDDLCLNTYSAKGSGLEVEFRHGLNSNVLEHEIDYDSIINDLLLLGYGEGYWQLNGTVEDTESITAYGRRQGTITEREIEHDDVLTARKNELIAILKNPRITYRVEVIDWQDLTFDVGDIVYISYPKLGVNRDQKRIVEFRLDCETNRFTIDVGEARPDVFQKIIQTADRVAIEASFQQGSTAYLPYIGTGDNFSPTIPYILRVYIPADVKQMGYAKLSFWLAKFRAFSAVTASGGGQTTSSGGGQTTSDGGGTSTSDGGGQTTSDGGQHMHNIELVNWETLSSEGHTHTYSKAPTATGWTWDHSHTVSDHSHTVSDHTHTVSNHTHGITATINELSLPGNVSIKINDIDRTAALGGPWNSDQLDIDIKNYLTIGQTNTISFYATQLGRMDATCNIKAFTLAKVS